MFSKCLYPYISGGEPWFPTCVSHIAIMSGMFVDECMACLRYSILSRSPLILRCHITVPGLLESFWIRALSSTCESFGIFPAGNSVVSFGLLRLVLFS